MKKKQEISLSIPQPCTQDWDKMTLTERGRHCASCNKTVIDFSNYTDRELADFFKKTKGEVCGRINNYQVNRPILITEQPNRSIFHKLLYGTALASWLGITSTANAQSSNPTTRTELKVKDVQLNNTTKDSAYIHGELIDDKSHQPLPFSNIVIYINGTQITGGVTDINGKFTIGPFAELPDQKIELKGISEGYEDRTILLKSTETYISVNMKADTRRLLMPVGVIVTKPRPFNTTGGSTFDRNDSPYLSPKPH